MSNQDPSTVTAAALRCPLHGIPDCSALLNGCVLPRELGYCPRADVDAAIEGVAETYKPEGVAIWWAHWLKAGPVERARLLLQAASYGGMVAT